MLGYEYAEPSSWGGPGWQSTLVWHRSRPIGILWEC